MVPGFSAVRGRGWQQRLSPLTHASSKSTVRFAGFVFPVFLCAYTFFKAFTHTRMRVFVYFKKAFYTLLFLL